MEYFGVAFPLFVLFIIGVLSHYSEKYRPHLRDDNEELVESEILLIK